MNRTLICMEPNLSEAQATLAEADAAYTRAVQDAAHTGKWYTVPPAAQAAHQARDAVARAQSRQDHLV